jgi:hypothetical protein
MRHRTQILVRVRSAGIEFQVDGLVGLLGIGLIFLAPAVIAFLAARTMIEGIVMGALATFAMIGVFAVLAAAAGLLRFSTSKNAGDAIPGAFDGVGAARAKRPPPSEREIAARKRHLADLLAKFDAMPTVDDRSADEIIGYNARGHFD